MGKSKRKCRHIETGAVYYSVIEMSKALGVSKHKIYHILKGSVKDSIGVEYVEDSFVGVLVEEAKCIKCNVVKPREDFGIDKRTNNIRGYTCKACRAKKEKERRLELGKDEMRIRRTKSHYNVTRKEAERLCSVSECECCGTKFILSDKMFPSQPHIDHCHETGKVRGVLCAGCNLALGHAREDINVLNNLIKYINKNN